MIKFLPDSYASKVIYYLAISVEFPWSAIELIPGDHTMIIRAVRKLKSEGYILVYNKGRYKSLRLAKKSLDILDKVHPGLYDYYMTISENHTFRGVPAGEKKLAMQLLSRKHRVAEVKCMMELTGTAILPNDKPELIINAKREPLISDLSTSLFYSSKEIKNIDVSQRHKTEFSRIIGLFISEGGSYNIYNVGNGKFKWASHGENKAQLLTSRVLNANFLYDGDKTGFYKSSSAIMFVNTFSALNTILTARHSLKDENGFEFLSFDNTYENIYLLPLDYNGAMMLKIMSTENWHNKLINKILNAAPISGPNNIESDAKINDKFVLMMFDGNIARLKRFNQSLYIFKNHSNFQIICFPWQRETIEKYLDFCDIEIKTVDEETVFSDFFSL